MLSPLSVGTAFNHIYAYTGVSLTFVSNSKVHYALVSLNFRHFTLTAHNAAGHLQLSSGMTQVTTYQGHLSG